MANPTMTVTPLDRVKIQAEVLIPIFQALQQELGSNRARELIRRALGDSVRKLAEQMRPAFPGSPVENAARAFELFASGDALDYEVVERTDQSLAVNVTGCRYARFYEELGAPELGFLFVCGTDFDFAEAAEPRLRLERTQTLMQGASHCDFRLRVK